MNNQNTIKPSDIVPPFTLETALAKVQAAEEHLGIPATLTDRFGLLSGYRVAKSNKLINGREE